MSQHKIRISPDGTIVHGLYIDDLDWGAIGDVNIGRATEIRFNNYMEAWEVVLLPENKILPLRFAKRSQALKYEKIYLENLNYEKSIERARNAVGECSKKSKQ